jgi:putative two-component system response regulator
MDGIELCRKIRNTDLPAYIYVILLTRHGEKEDMLTALSAGADDFITKPLDPVELKLKIRIGERILSLETRDVTIFALAKLAESRDFETGMHLERMRNYSKTIAAALAGTDKYKGIITPEYIHNIYLTSPLHDIGKIGIPDSVLLKPEKLNDEEWVIMKTHPQNGADTLGAALEQFPEVAFLKMARDIALSHHEKYDGSGYPCQTEGKEIPLSGRIVALADVYDALTSNRVYKDAFTTKVAHSIIGENGGKHFDPDVVKAFENNEPSFLRIFKELSDK